MIQKYTSKQTSINIHKLPAVYKKIQHEIAGKRILDYGCGKFTSHIKKFVKENGGQYMPFDPYNQTKRTNERTLQECHKTKADMAIISNVLNVIAEDEIIKNIVHETMELAETAVVTVYEGNRTGTGKATGKDQYQRNQPLKWYAEFIKELGYRVSVKNGIIRVTKGE